jgi:hypothetical protein
MSRTVNPELVKTLDDWTRRWGKVKNLGFDPESREPTVYAADGSKTRVSSFPWKRGADVITVLTTPTDFGEGAVRVAKERYDDYQTRRGQMIAAIEDPLIQAEKALLEAWRTYYATPADSRKALRDEVATAERAVRDLETTLGNARFRGRAVRNVKEGKAFYVPPIPSGRREITVTESASV